MFKDKLKDLRKNHNMTQDELASKLSISRQSISKWENGLSYPTRLMLNKICEVFNVSFDELLNSEEVVQISLDNNTNVKKVRRNVVLSTILILIVSIGLMIAVWIFNDRINQIESLNTDLVLSDVLLGFIVLDNTGINSYDRTDESTLINLIHSDLYPYLYTSVEDNQLVTHANKIFDNSYVIVDDDVENNATIYIKRDNGVHIYSVHKIFLSLSDERMYLSESTSIMGSSLGSFTVTFEDSKNEIINKNNLYNVTLKSIDNIDKIELYTYNESYEYIEHIQIYKDDVISMHSEALYFVIRETHTTPNDESYLNKIVVNYDEIDYSYYYQVKTFVENNFASQGLIQIKTTI